MFPFLQRALLRTSLSALLWCCAAHSGAADTGHLLRNYAAQLLPDSVLHYASQPEGRQRQRIAGIVHGKNPAERQALLFVLDLHDDGRMQEILRSATFDFSDPSARTDIEIVESHGNQRFSLQVNARSACGVYVSVYRFALIRGEWRVTGLDTSEPACGPQQQIEPGTEVSRNFLSGKHITREFRRAKVLRTDIHQHPYPVFPLQNFAIFDRRYEQEPAAARP